MIHEHPSRSRLNGLFIAPGDTGLKAGVNEIACSVRCPQRNFSSYIKCAEDSARYSGLRTLYRTALRTAGRLCDLLSAKGAVSLRAWGNAPGLVKCKGRQR